MLSKQDFLRYKGRTTYERVYSYLSDYIKTCSPEETHLPYESEITQTLQVGRNTVRHALALLRENGIIKTLQRSGSRIVAQTSGPMVPTNPHQLLSNRKIGILFTSNLKTYSDHKPFVLLNQLEQCLNFYDADILSVDMTRPQFHRDPVLVAESFRKFRPEVIVNLSPEHPEVWLKQLRTLGCKIIHFDRDLDLIPDSVKCLLTGIDLVSCNHLAGIRQMLDQSCTDAEQIIYAANQNSMYWAGRRAEVIRAFCKEYRVSFQLYVETMPFPPKSEIPTNIDVARFLSLLDERKKTAVFAQNDFLAVLILDAIRDSGRTFPNLRIIGHDNHPKLHTNYQFDSFGYSTNSCISTILNMLDTYFASPMEILNTSRIMFINFSLCERI